VVDALHGRWIRGEKLPQREISPKRKLDTSTRSLCHVCDGIVAGQGFSLPPAAVLVGYRRVTVAVIGRSTIHLPFQFLGRVGTKVRGECAIASRASTTLHFFCVTELFIGRQWRRQERHAGAIFT